MSKGPGILSALSMRELHLVCFAHAVGMVRIHLGKALMKKGLPARLEVATARGIAQEARKSYAAAMACT